MGKFDKPSRVNIVSIFFLLVLAAGAYAVIQFGPPYYRRWKAAGVLSEIANKYYANRLKGGPSSTETENQLRPELMAKLGEVGIDGTTVQATFRKSMTEVSVQITYREMVKHWFVGKTTTLDFTLMEEAKKEKE